MASELESDLQDTVDWGRIWFVDFNAGKTAGLVWLVLLHWCYWCGNGWVCPWRKIIFWDTGIVLSFSSKLHWGSFAKTASKKITSLIRSMKCLSLEVTLYLYKSTIWPCMEYCCHVWAGAPSCYLELLDKLKKQACRTVGPLPAPILNPWLITEM